MVQNKDTFPIFQLWYVRFLRKIAETVTVQMPIKKRIQLPSQTPTYVKSVPAHHIFRKTWSSRISFCSFSAIYVYKLMEKSNNIDSHKKPNAGNTEGERNFYHLKFLNLRCLKISRHVLFGPPSAATNTTRLALIYKQIGASISRQNWS